MSWYSASVNICAHFFESTASTGYISRLSQRSSEFATYRLLNAGCTQLFLCQFTPTRKHSCDVVCSALPAIALCFLIGRVRYLPLFPSRSGLTYSVQLSGSNDLSSRTNQSVRPLNNKCLRIRGFRKHVQSAALFRTSNLSPPLVTYVLTHLSNQKHGTL